MAVVALALAPLVLLGASASTLGGLGSDDLWTGTSQQTQYAKATIQWGLGWDSSTSQWVAKTADTEFFTDLSGGAAATLQPNHTVSVALTLNSGKFCTTSQTTGSSETAVTLQFNSGTCAGIALSIKEIASASIAIDGSVVIGSQVNSADSSSSHQAGFTAPVEYTETSGITRSSDASGNATLVIAHAIDPGNAKISLTVIPPSGNTFISQDSTTLPPTDYHFAADASGKLGTLTITVPKSVSLPDNANIHVAVTPIQTLTNHPGTYGIGLYNGVATYTQVCPVLPDDLNNGNPYDAALDSGQSALLPISITGTTASGQLVTSGISYRCDFIGYSSASSFYVRHSLTNSTGITLSSATMTFDLSRNPVNAALASNLQASTSNSYGEQRQYDPNSHMLTVTYSQPLANAQTATNLQLDMSNVPEARDDSAQITLCVVRSDDRNAQVKITATSTSEFPKTWSSTIDLNQWITNASATDILDPGWGYLTVGHNQSQPGIYTVTSTPSNNSMQGMTSKHTPATVTLSYHKTDWSTLNIDSSKVCQ